MAAGSRAGVNLFVSRLHWTTGIDVLREYFSQYGKVSRSVIFYDKETGFSRGFGVIKVDSWNAANIILEKDWHLIGRSSALVRVDKNETGRMDTRLKDMPTVEDGGVSDDTVA